MSDRYKRAAKHLRDFAGITYTTARALTHGELLLAPRSPDCVIAATLSVLREDPRYRIASTEGLAAKPCRCEKCAPAPAAGKSALTAICPVCRRPRTNACDEEACEPA